LEGENGHLILQGDLQTFANAVHRLLHDAQRCETIGNAIRPKALQKHSIERAMKKLLEIFEDLEKSRAA
jgi:glycosyltransferase involved in cell wall biosynthesis